MPQTTAIDRTLVTPGVNAGPRLDRLTIGRFHRRLFALVGAGMFFDGFDLYLASSVLGALAHSGFSTLALNGWFATFSFAGMMLGAAGSGLLGDQFGRRFSYQANLAIYGLASFAAALAPDMTTLIAARFVIGIGLGAEIVVGYATFTEFVPPGVRGRWCGILAMPIQCSLFVASVTGLLVIPRFGWRLMFVIAGAGAMVVWYLRKNLPESPRWLESRGRHAEAEAILLRIEAESAAPPFVAPPVLPRAAPVASLLSPSLWPRLAVGAVCLSVLNIVIFGFLSFVPTFLVQQGFSVVRSIGFNTVMSLGGPLGGLIALLVADRVGRKPTLVVTALLAAGFGACYPFVGSGIALTGVGLLLTTAIFANSVTAFAMFVPESFPTEVRLRGTGFCNTIGRVVGALTPLAVVPLFSAYGVAGVITLLLAALALQVIVVATLGVETRLRSLEALAPEAARAPALGQAAA